MKEKGEVNFYTNKCTITRERKRRRISKCAINKKRKNINVFETGNKLLSSIKPQ